jgi:Rad3-related DNA helicase|tara:strand:+ start:1295 stop:1681 length:387 start_codon:yes stop_codon:yes gene_type:complete
MVIDKALNPDPKRKPEKAFKFASDFDKLKFDVEQNIIDSLREAYEQEKKKGQSFSDWLNTKDKDYLIRIPLKEGGDPDRSFKPSDTGEYKQKNLIDRVNEIMLFRSTLSPKDNAIIDDLLERTLGGKK